MDSRNSDLILEVTGLFNLYDYTLRITDSGKPLILTGPNGYGKTTLLKILHNLKSQNLIWFLTFPFSSIRLHYGDGKEISVISTAPQSDEESENTEDSVISFSGGPNGEFKLNLSDAILAEAISTNAWPGLRPSIERHRDFTSCEFASRLETHSEEINRAITRSQQSKFLLVLSELPDINFVQALRIYDSMLPSNLNAEPDDRKVNREEIVKISDDLSRRLRHEYWKFLSKSQQSDKKFISNILTCDESITEGQYDEQAKEITNKIKRLSKFNLTRFTSLPEYNASKSFILKSYIDDLRDNLSIYDPILSQLELFIHLLSTKNLAGKEIEIARSNDSRNSPSIRIRSKTDKSFIELERLSSGEKNQIIMLYDLIFRIPEKSILLIDEPELSLHVAWQMDFLDDIEKIATMKQLRAVVATHSPQIINSRWDDCYDLYEQLTSRRD